MAFIDYIKTITKSECGKQATFTMGAGVNYSNDVITFPAGSASYVSSAVQNEGTFTIGTDILILDKIVEDDTVTMSFTDEGPYVIDYYDLSTTTHYQEAIYFNCEVVSDCCNDNDGCGCSSIRNDDKNIVSKASFGVLTDERYLDIDYSGAYALQVDYDENNHEIVMSDSHINYAGDTTVYGIPLDNYRKKVMLTYLSFNKYDAQFIEQIVDSQMTASNVNEWRYSLGSSSCFYHNEDGCVVADSDFTNAIIFVEYITSRGNFLAAEATFPVKYSGRVDVEDNRPKFDGLYKSYFFLIPSLEDYLTATHAYYNMSSKFFFSFLDDNDQEVTLMFGGARVTKTDVGYTVIDYTIGITTTYDLTLGETGRADLIADYGIGDRTFFENFASIPNNVNVAAPNYPETYMAEDIHLITYELRDKIVDSIKDCAIPCEKQSYNEWLGLMQKKKAAKIHFCEENVTEAARIMFTLDERCKNC